MMNMKPLLVRMMEHSACLHEEQLQGQSRAIERIDAELTYKKERLDELKEDNRRMEEKLDDIKDCLNKMQVASNKNDSELEVRLKAVETTVSDLEKKVDTNKSDIDKRTNQAYVKIGLIFTAITILISVLPRIIGG